MQVEFHRLYLALARAAAVFGEFQQARALPSKPPGVVLRP